jgi:hypothetical protein
MKLNNSKCVREKVNVVDAFSHYIIVGKEQSCQMVYFQTENPNLGHFWRVLQSKMLTYFMYSWSILQPFGILWGHLVYFVVIWYIFPRFGILYQEKSGNPGKECVVRWDLGANFRRREITLEDRDVAV